MDLLDRLRPQWRHSDPAVRAAAVREMGDADADRLASIATDDVDARVRRAAIEKLRDTAVLAGIAARDADEGLRTLAAERVRALLVAEATSDAPADTCAAALARLDDERSIGAVAIAAVHATVRDAALARVTTDRGLRDVVRQGADAATRRAALERIADQGTLRSLAAGDLPAELAIRAVERLDDPDALRAVAHNRAASKAARQRARALLPADEPAAEDDAEPVVGRPPEIAGVVDPREAAAHRARMALEEARAGREALCARVEALEGPDALAELARAREAWAGLGPVPAAEHEAFARRFREAGEACVARDRARRAGEALHNRLQPLIREAESLAGSQPPPRPKRWNALEERWHETRGSDPGDAAVAELDRRFALAKERVQAHRQESEEQRAAAQQENVARLTALHARLEELAAAETVKPATARRELGVADVAIADPGPLPPTEVRATWVARLTEARDRLGQRLRQDTETEEWRRWANAGAQEELIQHLEGLLERNDLAEGSRLLGKLGDEWAQIATATPDKSRPLWERFRTARNELRRRCDAWMAENLAQKRALVAQLDGVAESTTWNETTDLVRRLQAEWKAIGPVPGKLARALWQEFHEPCDRFFARRKEHFAKIDAVRGGNAARKVALCEKAESLADSKDWDATTIVMKKLQADWKEVGPAPRPQDEQLWQRFRKACDRFFDRRKRRDELEREEELDKGRALVARLDAVVAALASDATPAASAPFPDDAQTAAPATTTDDEPPPDAAPVGDDASSPAGEADAAPVTDAGDAANADVTEPTAEAAPERAPAADDARATLDEVWTEWLRLDLGTGRDVRALRERLWAACERLAAAAPDALRGSKLDPETTRARREKLCVRIEKLVAPAADAAPKAATSLADMAAALRDRLATNTIATGRGTEAIRGDTAQEAEKLAQSWELLGPPLDDAARALAERFAAARARVKKPKG